MEFEKDPTITNDQRILAATRSLTINPLSANIIRDEAPEPLTVIERQPNVERDTENTAASSTLIQPSESEISNQQFRSRNQHFIIVATVAVVAISFIGLGFYITLT